MEDLLDFYYQLNPNNYNGGDLSHLIEWTSDAYDEIHVLREKLVLANKRLAKIADLAEEE